MNLSKVRIPCAALAAIVSCFVASSALATVVASNDFESTRDGFTPSDGATLDDIAFLDSYASGEQPTATPQTSDSYPFTSGFGSKYLTVDTGDDTLWRTFTGRTAGTYFDAYMQFMASTENFTYDAGAKLVVYLDAATSKLHVISGTSASDHTIITNALSTTLTPGTWARLTVNATPVADSNAFTFQILLNGNVLSTENSVSTFYSMYKEGSTSANIAKLGFKGTGAIDNLAIRSTDPHATAAATVNGERYATLEQALEEANGETITLAANANAITTPLAAGTTYCIAKNGHTFGGFTAVEGAIITESTYNGVTTYTSIIPLASDSISTPLAIWNGDFSSGTVNRGKFKQYMFNNPVSDGIVTLDTSSRPLILELTAYTNIFPFMAIVGLTDIPMPVETSSYFALLRAYTYTTSWIEAPGVFINSDKKFIGDWNGTRTYGTSESAYAPFANGTMDFVALSYKYDDATKVYLNGDLFYSSTAMRDTTIGYWRSFSIGGAYSTAGGAMKAAGMKVGYAAVLASNAQTDATFWSLKSLKTHETLTSSATSFMGGDAVGVNLNGGEVIVSSAQTVAALFVQEDTTLKFTGTGSLATTYNGSYRGPVYVAEGKTLTIDVSEAAIPSSGNVSYPLTASVFGNIVVTGCIGPAVLSNSGLLLGASGDAAPTTTSSGTIKFFSNGDCTVVPSAGNTATFDFSGVTGKPVIQYTSQPTRSGTVFTSTTVPVFVTDSAKWTGVICINAATVTNFTSNIYGNEHSLVRLNNVTGWLSAPGNYAFTNSVPVELVGTLTLNDGISANDDNKNRCTVFKKLSGNGTISGTANAHKVVVVIQDASEFTGGIGLDNKLVIFGDTMPSYDANNKFTDMTGSIWIMSGAKVTNRGFWWAVGGIKVFGELCASNLDGFGKSTTITTSDSGVLTLTNTSNVDDATTDYARIKGTGTLKYESTGNFWRTLSNNNFPTNMTIQNELVNGLGLKAPSANYTHVIGSLSGSAVIRSDFNTSYDQRNLKILQAKDTIYSGTFFGTDHIDTVTVAPGTSTAGTLTLSGTQTATNTLVVASGAKVNLTGTWVGATTVAGELGGTGTITGNLTLSDGATIKVTSLTDLLEATGTVTASGTVNIYLPEGTSVDRETTLISGNVSPGATFNVYIGSASTTKYRVVPTSTGLKIAKRGPIICFF